MDVLNYLKSIIGSNYSPYKRRLEPDIDSPIQIKIRKTNFMDNRFTKSNDNPTHMTPTSPSTQRRNFLLDPIKTKFDYSKLNAPIVIPDDDDDDCIEIKARDETQRNTKRNSLPKINATSTPLVHKDKNGSIELAGIKFPAYPVLNPERKSQSSTYLHQKQQFQNGKRPPIFNSIRDLKLFNKPRKAPFKLNKPSRDSILNESYRPDDKLRYEQLLRNIAPVSCSNKVFDGASFQQYVASSGMFSSRNRRLVELGKAKNPIVNAPSAFVDLTTSSKSSGSSTNRMSTRESIIKVLDDLDSENNKDSDSDVEVVLPDPPSPKPDIKVDRVNSLKSLDPEDRFHSDWVKNLLRKSKLETEERQKNIDAQQSYLKEISEITTELKANRLNEQVKRCLRIKDIILSEEEKLLEIPLPTLTSDQETTINNAINKRFNRDEVLSKKFSLVITRSHMLTLSGLEWLNDEVINFYMNLIIERGKLDKYPNAHAMNTFFYMRLNDAGYSGVKRWSRKFDVFSFDVLVVPIHLQMHWCMAIVDFRTKAISYYDSMGKSNQHCLELLLKYLVEEHLDKKKEMFDKSGWQLINVQDIPQQMNGSDCGMFACTFAEYISRDAPITFGQENMPYLRRKAVIEIIEGKLLIT